MHFNTNSTTYFPNTLKMASWSRSFQTRKLF